MKVGVFIADAQDAEYANRQCKESPAYRQICRQYPSATWNRRHLQTVRHMGMAGPELKGPVGRLFLWV